MQKIFAYFMRYHKQKGTHLDIIFKHRHACVIHMFDDHSMCTPECPAKRNQANNLPYKPKESYLNLKMHSDIRTDLLQIVEFYTQRSRLAEVFHQRINDKGTQLNEAINNSTVTLAPKTRNYATSFSFNDRISTMIGIHNFGYLGFYTAIYSLHGVELPKFLRKYLESKDEKKLKRRVYMRDPEVKKRRKTSYANKYVESTTMEEGYYCSNSGLNIESTIADDERKKEINKRKDHTDTLCKSGCGTIGHYNKLSYLCPRNKLNIKNVSEYEGELQGKSVRKAAIGKNATREKKKLLVMQSLRKPSKREYSHEDHTDNSNDERYDD